MQSVKNLKKPKAILFDVSGTLTQSTFILKLLVPYFQQFHQCYLDEHINQPECNDMIDKLRIAAQIDQEAPKIAPEGTEKSPLIDSISEYVNYMLTNNKTNIPFIMFRFNVWFDGFDKDRIATPVYSDVAIQIQKWRLNQNIKLYVLSNGWSVATKKFLEKTNQGNLAMLITDYFDTELGPLNDPATFTKAVEKVNETPEDMLFLTKSVEEAKAAKQAGLITLLICTHRKDVEAVKDECIDIPIARTFNEIEFSDAYN